MLALKYSDFPPRLCVVSTPRRELINHKSIIAMTAVFFLTYRSENGQIGHRMAEVEYSKSTNIEKVFFDWCSDEKELVVKEINSEATITSINLMK